MKMRVTKQQAKEFVDMLNDYVCDNRVNIPGITYEEARNTRREPLDEKIHAALRAIVAKLPPES